MLREKPYLSSDPKVYGDKKLLDEWKSLKVGMERFREEKHIYTPGILKKDEEKLREVKKGDTPEVDSRSDIAEAIVAIVPDRYGWLGSNFDVCQIVTEEYDDRINRVDGIKEVVINSGENGHVIRWAEDVTRRHPKNHNPGSKRVESKSTEFENRDKVEAKVKGIKNQIGNGHDGGNIKYFYSVAGPDILLELIHPITIPEVVISFPGTLIEELKNLHFEVRNGNREAEEALRNHPAKFEYLAQIRYALEAQIQEIEYMLSIEGSGSKKGKTLEEALGRADDVLEFIDGLFGDSDYEMQNTWLRESYDKHFNRGG